MQDYIFFSHFLTTHSIPFIHLLFKMVLIVYHSGTYDTHVMAVNKYDSFVIVMYFVLWCPLKPQAKVAVEYERGVKTHFAKCVVFLKDNKDNYFVVVQWYDAVGRQPFDVSES